MSEVITSKVDCLVVMEPLAIIRDSLTHILRDSHCCYGMNIKAYSSFKELMNVNISGTIITEVYDDETTLIEGVIILRELKKNNPHADMIIVTNVEIESILAQTNADAIISKNTSIECLRKSFFDFSNKKGMINSIFYNVRKIKFNYDYLSDFELDFISCFSHHMTLSEFSAKTGISYCQVSRIKNSIMKKLNIRNKTVFSKLLALLSKKYGEGSSSTLVFHTNQFY